MAKKAASKKKKVKKGVKRKIKKTASRRGKTTKITYHSTKEIKVEKALVENFIGLQKVMVSLSSKFDNLANQISKLLELFEISAKALARKEFGIEGSKDSKKIMEKLDNISERAGLIGKGLVLIHESGQDLSPQKAREMPKLTEIKRPPQLRKMPIPKIIPKGPRMEGYQKSINPISEPKKSREVPEEHDQKNF